MTKASTIRAQRGQTQQRQRSKPTTGYVGRREPGPHGLTLRQSRFKATPLNPTGWRRLLFGRKS